MEREAGEAFKVLMQLSDEPKSFSKSKKDELLEKIVCCCTTESVEVMRRVLSNSFVSVKKRDGLEDCGKPLAVIERNLARQFGHVSVLGKIF